MVLKRLYYIFIGLFFIVSFLPLNAQDRFSEIEKKLGELSRTSSPGLKEVVDFSVSGVTIQEFLRGLAESNNLNISVDPTLNIKVINNFTNEKVSEILLFLCKEYDLDISFVGSIMSFKKYILPTAKPIILPPKEINVTYNNYTDALTLDLRLDSLERVVKKITQVTKKNVILANGIGGKMVSVYIENMPFDNALDKMALSNNLKLTKTKDGFYFLESYEEVAKNQSSSNGNGSSSRNNGYGNRDIGGNDKLGIDILLDSLTGKNRINVRAIDVPVADIIKLASRELKIDYFIFSEPKGNTTTYINNVDFDQLLNLLFQGTEHTFKKQDNVYLIGERTLEGMRKHKVLQLQNRSAEIMLENIPADLKKGVDIKYFKELNSLILSGSEIRITEIESFVKQLDKTVPMILIEVILINVSNSRTTKTGITAGLGDSSKVTKGTILPGLDFTFSSQSINNLLSWLDNTKIFNLGRVTPNFYMSLSANESLGNVEVTSTPKLSTLNGHEATLKIGESRPYELPTQNTIGTLTTSVVRTVSYGTASANLTIKINPLVSGDDQITLEIDVDNTGFTAIPTAGPPPTATSAFKSIIRVRNEEMLVLGGLEKLERSRSGSGIPLLSRIPVLKYLFGSRTNSKTKSKQLVFIRPTIIY